MSRMKPADIYEHPGKILHQGKLIGYIAFWGASARYLTAEAEKKDGWDVEDAWTDETIFQNDVNGPLGNCIIEFLGITKENPCPDVPL